MNRLIKNSIVLSSIVFFTSCNWLWYTPRSKKNIQREQPSVVLLNRIIEYREEFYAWPYSKEQFISKGKKYKEAFDGFPYLDAVFKVIDDNRMTFFFSHHNRDEARYERTKQIDLNNYHGKVKFYKTNNKFIWKLKMH
jgi:hypothetical protein